MKHPRSSTISWIALGIVFLNAGHSMADSVPPSPGHMVAFFPDTQCPAGWSEATYLRGLAPIAAGSVTSPQTTVGTAMGDATAPTHEHDYSGSISLPSKSLTGDCGCCNDNGAKDGDHGFSGTTTGLDSGVPYLQMLACEKDPVASPPPVDPYPLATVAFFNATACPTGWEKAVGLSMGWLAHWPGANGYEVYLYFVGTDSDGDGVIRGRGSSLCNGVSDSNELTDFGMQVVQNGAVVAYYGWNTQHAQCNFNLNYNIADLQILASAGQTATSGITVGITDNSNYAGAWTLFSNSSGSKLQLNQAATSMAATAWGNGEVALTNSGRITNCKNASVCEPMSADGFFVMPFCDYNTSNGDCTLPVGDPGRLVGIPLRGQAPTHSHAFASSISLTEQTYVPDSLWPNSCGSLTSDGSHGFTAFTKAAGGGTPYMKLLLCEKTSGTGTAPSDATDPTIFFNQTDCPDGWKPSSTEASGQMIVGLPQAGSPNKQFGGPALKEPGDRDSHTHTLSGKINIGYQDIDRDSGGSAKGYAVQGSYPYGGNTVASDSELPYLTVLACQPCVQGDTNPVCTSGGASTGAELGRSRSK